MFSGLLESSGAAEWLTLEDPFTVFAPTNRAFAKIPAEKFDELLNEPKQQTLKFLLSYHFMPGKHQSDDLVATMSRKSITGDEITFSNVDGFRVNGARLEVSNVEATNGVIHQVDTVLVPAMRTAVKRGGVLEEAKTMSFAPADKKFKKARALGPGSG